VTQKNDTKLAATGLSAIEALHDEVFHKQRADAITYAKQYSPVDLTYVLERLERDKQILLEILQSCPWDYPDKVKTLGAKFWTLGAICAAEEISKLHECEWIWAAINEKGSQHNAFARVSLLKISDNSLNGLSNYLINCYMSGLVETDLIGSQSDEPLLKSYAMIRKDLASINANLLFKSKSARERALREALTKLDIAEDMAIKIMSTPVVVT
jgi:hypothetical protein